MRRPGRLAVGRHRHEADLAAAGGVDELQRHLDAVAVGLVEDQLAVTLQRVGGGIQLAGQRRVGDLLHADDHVHGASLLPAGTAGSQSARDQTGRHPARSALVPSDALRILLVVNSFASSVTARNTVVVHRRLAQRARRRDRRDEPARPRHPLRPGRRPPRRRRGRRLRRRRHAERGRDRHRRHRHRARRAARRVDQRVRPHASGCPTTPSPPPSMLGRRHRRRATSARSGSAGSTAATSASTPASATTPPSCARSSSGRRSSAGSGHPLFIYAGAHDVAHGLRPPRTRTSGLPAPAAATCRRRLLHDRAQHQPVHVPRQPAARPVARRRRSTAAWSPSRSARCRPTAILGSLGGALRGGGVEAEPAPRRAAPTCAALDDRARRRRSRTRSTATTSARRARLEFEHVPDAVQPRVPGAAPEPSRARERRERDVGHVGADAVDAPLDQLAPSRSGSSQVHVLTREPGGVAAARSVGRSTRPTHGCSAAWPRPTSDVAGVRRRHRPSARPCGSCGGAARRQRSTVSRRNDEISHRSSVAAGERGAATSRRRSTSSASKSGSRGSFLISTLTHIPAQASSAAPSVGTCAGRSAAATSTIAPAVGEAGRRGGRRARRRRCGGRRARPRRRPSPRPGGTRPPCSPRSATRGAPVGDHMSSPRDTPHRQEL